MYGITFYNINILHFCRNIFNFTNKDKWVEKMKQAKQKQPQISAHVSYGTKSLLDRLSRARGLRKAFVLEQALLYHFRALKELPEEAFLPPRLVLSRDSFDKIVEFVDNPPPPTKAMQELVNGVPDTDSI